MPQWGKREIETISLKRFKIGSIRSRSPARLKRPTRPLGRYTAGYCAATSCESGTWRKGSSCPKKPTVRRPTLTAEQERTTLKAIVGQPFEAAVLLGAALGLRRCEACAVRIEDVDWRSDGFTYSADYMS